VDRHLKERLVGAAVLVAAAIILIPEMLSGPHEGSATQSNPAAEVPDGGVKTYTIDLNAPKATDAKESSKTTAAVPPPAPVPAVKPQTPSAQPVVTEAHKESANETAIAQVARDKDKPLSSKPTPDSDASEKNVAEKSHGVVAIASTPVQTASGKGNWAVQVASFSARATSERIASELKAKNFPAFVTAFDSKGQTMYRVRVGPVEDRAAAEELLTKIKPLHPGAAVVPQ
jgi:DedD protein